MDTDSRLKKSQFPIEDPSKISNRYISRIDSAVVITYFLCMKTATSQDQLPPFEELLSKAIAPLPQRQLKRGECQDLSGKKCTLCAAHKITYDTDYKIKNDTLQEFWKLRGLTRLSIL